MLPLAYIFILLLNFQMVFAALAMVRSEILWYFSHVNVMVGKSKGARVIPIEMVRSSSYLLEIFSF